NTCREKRGNGSRSMLYARVPCPPRGPASPADAASGPRPMETLRPAGGTPVTVTLPWPRPPAGSGGTVVRTGRTQAAQVHQQQGNGGRGDTADAAGLADGLRSHLAQLLPYFRAQARHGVVVETGRDDGVLVALLALDLLRLALQVAGVLARDLHLLGHLRVGASRANAGNAHQGGVVHLRPP